MASRSDVIFDYGTINPTYISLAERVQKQTGVPYLLFDGGFTQIARSYAAAGEALGTGERARKLAHYTSGYLPMLINGSQGYRRRSALWFILLGDHVDWQTALKGSINVGEHRTNPRAQCRG